MSQLYLNNFKFTHLSSARAHHQLKDRTSQPPLLSWQNGKKLELSDPQVAALMGQQKKLTPWISVNYNDEPVLLDLRVPNPAAEWTVTRDLFNELVPPKRKRTVDALTNKWKVLKARSNKQASRTIQAAPTVTDPEYYLPSQYIEEKSFAMQGVPTKTHYDAFEASQYDIHARDQAAESLDAQNQAECYDMLSTHWDSTVDFDGYLMEIASELEKMEAARSVAIAAASSMLA